ncbi:MAG TPA: hypothetical protein VIK10_09970 [Prolixibacteraceae bacterium]
MKKLLMVFLVTMVAVGSSFAQQRGGTPEERLAREIDGLTTALSLTKDQVAKVTPIIIDAQKKRSDMFTKMREGGNMDRDKMREESTKMQAETDKALKAALPAEQGTKLDAFRKKQAEERAARQNN